jgi:hypothetical protein
MIEVLNFIKATIIKLNAIPTNLNVWGILMSHCRTDKDMDSLKWLILPWDITESGNRFCIYLSVFAASIQQYIINGCHLHTMLPF